MSRVLAWRRYLRFWRPDIAGDIDEELGFHLSERVDELVALRVSPDDAERQARAELGDTLALRERLRAIDARIAARRGGISWCHDLVAEFREAFHTCRRAPGFTAVIVVTLALGIGATTAVVSVIDATLLRPLPFHDTDRLMLAPGSQLREDAFAGDSGVFAEIGEYAVGSLNLENGAEGVRVKVSQVTPNLFTMLGVTPVAGNAFAEADGRSGGPDVAVLAYSLWQRQFGGAPDVIGRRVLLNQHPYVVLGVMPANFGFPESSDLWIPLTHPMSAAGSEMFKLLLETRRLIRLAPGVSVASANAAACAALARLSRYPIPHCETVAFIRPLRASLVGDARTPLLMLAGVVAVLLMITCTNVSSMLLARAPSRRREIAVRAALGASRGRLMRKLLVESVMLSLIGGIGGVALAFFGVRLLSGIVPSGIADVSPVRLDYRVLFVTVVIALGSGPLFGALPARVATRGDLHDSLRSVAPSGAFGFIRRLGRLLVACEIAAALVLMVGAGLLTKSLIRVLETDTGVNGATVVSGRVALARSTYHMPADRRPFFRAVLTELTHAPGVQSAALVSALPLRGDQSVRLSFDIPGAPPAKADERFAEQITASAGYFETMRIPLLAGRFFSADDRADAPPVAVVSQSLASANWPGESAIGKRIVVGFQEIVPRTIVGVVRDVRTESIETKEHTQIYVPFDQSPSFEATIVVRGNVPASMLIQHVRDAIRNADPHQFAYDLETMDAVVSATLTPRRTNVMLIGACGGIAVLLSAIGIYALLAFGVAQRTREIGIRMALGARRGNVARLVVRDGTVAALVGVAAGVVGALALTRLLRSLLYEVSPLDPTTFVAASLAVLVVVALASYLPARRATRVDPLVAIRAE